MLLLLLAVAESSVFGLPVEDKVDETAGNQVPIQDS